MTYIPAVKFLPVARIADYTAAVNDYVQADATAGAFTVTLPASPARGAYVAVWKTDATSNGVTVAPPTGGSVAGDTDGLTLASRYAGAVVTHVGSNTWLTTAILT